MKEAVISVYRPREGSEEQLIQLLQEHIDVLRREDLITDRPAVLLRSPSDGCLIQIFVWKSERAVERAHENPAVSDAWKELEEVSEFLPLDALEESGSAFPHFAVVEPSSRGESEPTAD